MTKTKAPEEKQTTRKFLKTLEPGTVILKVQYRRRGGSASRYGVYDGFNGRDDTYFQIKEAQNGTAIIDVNDVIEIREVPLVLVVELLSEREAMRERFLGACPIVHQNKPEQE